MREGQSSTGDDAELQAVWARLGAAGTEEQRAKVLSAWAAICDRRATQPRWFIPATMPAVVRRDVADQAPEVEHVQAPEAYGMSPTLGVCLDLWGQVVAHRVACRSGVRWAGEGRSQHDRVGLDVQAWQIQRDWRRAVGNESSLPSAVRPSDWARELAAARASEQLDARLRRAMGGLTRTVGPRATQAAFLTVHGLLSEEALWRSRWGVKGPGLITWLFVVPHLYGTATDIPGWCFLRYGERCDDRAFKEAESALRNWAKHAKPQIAATFPTTFDAIEVPPMPRVTRVA